MKTKVVYTNFKIGQYFILKDRTPWKFAANVVYKFECSVDRAVTYIGMTTRPLVIRAGEHFDPRKLSAVQSHVATCNGCANAGNFLDNFRVLRKCNSDAETEVCEALLIQQQCPPLNKQLGATNGCSFVINVFK